MGAVLAPIILGAGASASALATAATAINIGLYVATTAASYFIQQAMAPKPETGTKLDAVLGGAAGQSFIFGEKETAGSFIYTGTWGIPGRTPNAYLVNVFCLQDFRAEGFSSRLWTDKKNTIDFDKTWMADGNNLGSPVTAFDAGGAHHLGVKFHDGTQTSADGYLRAVFGSDANRPWTSGMVGRGRTLAIVTQKYNKDEPEGEVQPLFVVKGIKLYDWRKDSTNGGSGSHRYGTYSTYEHSANPVVVAYNIMRGIYYGNDWMYGGQEWPKGRFDNDTWTAAANVCDENVSLAGGGTEKRYRVGGEVDLSEEPWTVIERLLKACNGRIVDNGGIFKVYCGGVGASVFSFTDDDILVSEELTGSLFPTSEKIANTITGTYIEPNNAGNEKAYKPRTQSDFVAEDGGERKISMDFEYVRSNTQAQRLARLALRDNRRFRTFRVALWTQGRKLEPCDAVSWTSSRFGFSGKKFIVGDVELHRDGVTFVNLREANDNDADWSTDDEDAYDTGVYGDIPVAAQTLSATVTAVSVTDDGGNNRRPAIRIQSTLDGDFVDCDALLWKVRKSASVTRVFARGRIDGFFDPNSDDYGDGVFTDNSFMAGRTVQVSYRIKPESDRPTSWSTWENVTLTNARMKIQLVQGGSSNDIDAVDTDNIVANAVQGKADWTSSNSTQSWTNRNNNQSATAGFGNSGGINNPNPSPVFVRIKASLSAKVTAANFTNPNTARAVTTLEVYSEKTDGSNSYTLYSVSRTGTRNQAGNQNDGSGDIDVTIMDTYSSSDNRRYRARAVFELFPSADGANVDAECKVTDFSGVVAWSKR
jgi:hypothetical protein